ncbi:diol dehydratase small subunit [Mycolicibacterium austroafricanum]|uniref:Diol dehydratase small subunit n=1 Tax=Mycolicibacterium austroafricanum TaxID=39687 RepID=A0ABT8HFD9_MYCAO|nr:diol dehydratase small subunit [Mycolicibacterium austroafricanum]MDN4519476.1 diol dehydratase small subunit [Mycolicibacterium austroafricanum]
MAMSEISAASRENITVGNAVDGKLGLGDLRMDPATLAHQAAVAEAGGNPQLAENFRRAAELATIDDEQVMALYEALRPHRSTAAELEELRASLIAGGAPRCAALVEQAAAVYARRGLLR